VQNVVVKRDELLVELGLCVPVDSDVSYEFLKRSQGCFFKMIRVRGGYGKVEFLIVLEVERVKRESKALTLIDLLLGERPADGIEFVGV